METSSIELWHGSSHVIKHPEYGMGKPNNDYGRGFYCTRSIELAKEWACAGLDDGFANRYTLTTDGLTFLDLSQALGHFTPKPVDGHRPLITFRRTLSGTFHRIISA